MRGIVLAAGQGRRMGGPKALLTIGGVPLVRLHAQRLLEAGCAQVTVVTSQAIELQVRSVLAFSTAVVVMAASTQSQAHSLSVAVWAVGRDDARCTVVTPVDVLPAAEQTIRRLIDALDDHVAVTPRFGTHGGHPVIIDSRFLGAYRAPDPPPLHDWLTQLGARRLRLPVDDSAVAFDFNTPGDLERLGIVRQWARSQSQR